MHWSTNASARYERSESVKVKLLIDKERYESVYKEFTDHGIEISDDATLVVTETGNKHFLTVKDKKGDRVMIDSSDIVFVESYGHKVDVHTNEAVYTSGERIYVLEGMLDNRLFCRVSNSVIIQKRHVKNIRPALSMKFVLTMSEGTVIDVTRSYYASFKQFFGL